MSHPIDAGCIFCKIIAGAIPCHRLYESDTVLSFLDIGPLSRGHALIIPKGHWASLDQVPDDVAARCAVAVKTVGKAIAKVTAAQGWNVLQNNGAVAGQVVMHVHFHVIPRSEGDGLGFRWPAGKLAGEEAVKLVKAIREAM